MPPRRNGPRGGNFGNRRDGMRRGGPGGRARFDRGNRNSNEAGGFRRRDSEDFQRRSNDDFPDRGGFRRRDSDDFQRRSNDDFPDRGGFRRRDSEDFQRRSNDDFPNRGGFSRRPGKNSIYNDQSDKKKKFWRETPDVKMKKPSRDTKQSSKAVPKPNVPKQGGKKIKPKKEDSGSENMSEDNELGDDMFGSDFSNSEDNEDEESEMEETRDEMEQEILDRDYKEFMASQKKERVEKLRDDKDYKSSDEDSSTDSDAEQLSSINSDDLQDEEDERDPDEIIKMYKNLLGKDNEKPKLSKPKVTEPKLTKPKLTEPKLTKPKLDENKTSGRATVLENEWNDFLQKNVYESPTQEKPDVPDENESEKNVQVKEEQLGKSISNKKEEAAKNKVEALKNKWKWFQKLTKDISNEQVVLPKELPDEIDDEIMEKEDMHEGKQKLDKEEFRKNVEELLAAEKSKISDSQFQQLKKLLNIDSLLKQSSNVETSPSAQTVESESILPSVKTIESGTESTHLKTSADETSSDSKKPTEPSNISKDDAESDREEKITYIAPKFTDDVERLKDTWHRFITCYEQSTGIFDHDLPYDLPNEEDEHEDFNCEDESKSDVGPKLELAHPPVLEKAEATAIVPKDDVSRTLTRVDSSDGKQKPSTSEETDDFDGDPGFQQMYDKAEDERDKDLNRLMYESYKITGSPEEFLEDHPEIHQINPELFPPNRPVLQWHHFKELWNRFVDKVTSYPGKAFEEYDKIVAARNRSMEKGTDITKELNLTSEPEKKKEEPLTEYEKTEAELKAAWKRYERENTIDPQQGLFETLVERGELDPKPEDIVSPEAEQTLRAFVSLLDHPERFDMKKYKASLSEEEIAAVQTGEALKQYNRVNQNESSATTENGTTAEQNQQNGITQNEPTSISQGRSSMAQKMWEYFVNMMRQRHEKGLEKFLSQQPQGAVPIGDNPDDVKGLWQKYINYTNSLQPPAEGKPEEFETLLASTTTAPPPPLKEEHKTEVAKTQGWNNLIHELDSLQERLKKPVVEPTTPVADTTMRRGWDVLSERMKNLSSYENDARKITRSLFEVADKKRMEYFYRQQFGDSEGRHEHQTDEPTTQNQSSEGMSPPEHLTGAPRPGNYDYRAYPGAEEQTPRYPNPYPRQYGTEVNQMASAPFGQNRQPPSYDQSSEQYAAGNRQEPWPRTNTYNREYAPNFPREPPVNRNFVYQDEPTPLHNRVSKTPLHQQRRTFISTPYSQQIPGQNEKPWSSAQEYEPSEFKSTKNWQSGSRPFMQQQDESLTPRTPSGEYSIPVENQYYQPSRGSYDRTPQDENCIHLTHQDDMGNHNLQTP